MKVTKGPSLDPTKFKHPSLSRKEHEQGAHLGIDSYADTSCAGRHTHVIKFLEDLTVSTATGFMQGDMKIEDLAVANVAYAFDTLEGDVIILIVNNTIYLGDLMDRSLPKHIQCMEKGIHIDIRPKPYCPGEETTQTFHIPSLDRIFPLEYHGVLPFLHVHRPTIQDYEQCKKVEITRRETWDPYAFHDLNFCSAETTSDDVDETESYCDGPIDGYFMAFHLGSLMTDQQMLRNNGDDEYV